MELKSRKVLITLTCFWLLSIMALGSWWLFLVVKTSRELHRNVMTMVLWEGAFFFSFLLFISGTLFYFYWQDLKKNRAMASFFTSLTHELKTPLASMRLQAEVIQETLHEGKANHRHLNNLTERLIEDAERLEDELDKLLQLSRIERGGAIRLEKIVLADFFNHFKEKNKGKINLEFVSRFDGDVWGDEFSLNLIFRNLISNSLRHAHSRRIKIVVEQDSLDRVQVIYRDEGGSYRGDLRQLGKLFQKSPRSKGQGIGLYLIKVLMKKMRGALSIENSPGLTFCLTFQKFKEGK